MDRATVEGRLAFLALKLVDGIDLNSDGRIQVNCAGDDVSAAVTAQTEELTKLFFSGTINLADPNHDGMLTFGELVSSPLSEIFQPTLSGGAVLRAEAKVDFSTLGDDLGNVLPSISAKILIDFGITWAPGAGVRINPPQVVIADISLDLGSFISEFAKPILDSIAEVLGPVDWLIGPDGFLNKRIPLLSDLLGKTITGKDLVVLFDPDNGPKVVAFLDFVEGLYTLIDLVDDAAAEGSVNLNFGDLVLAEPGLGGTANIAALAFVDKRFNLGLPAGSNSDLTKLANLRNVTLPPLTRAVVRGRRRLVDQQVHRRRPEARQPGLHAAAGRDRLQAAARPAGHDRHRPAPRARLQLLLSPGDPDLRAAGGDVRRRRRGQAQPRLRLRHARAQRVHVDEEPGEPARGFFLADLGPDGTDRPRRRCRPRSPWARPSRSASPRPASRAASPRTSSSTCPTSTRTARSASTSCRPTSSPTAATRSRSSTSRDASSSSCAPI